MKLYKIILQLLPIILNTLTANSDRSLHGDKNTREHHFPFIVYIKPSANIGCTGFIVHPSWVVSSAQCVTTRKNVKISDKSIAITAGAIDKDLIEEAQKRISKKIVVPEAFSTKNIGKHDISLIELATVISYDLLKVEEPFEMTERVNIVKFMDKEWPTSSNRVGEVEGCVSAEWGLMEKNTTLRLLDTTARHSRRGCPCIRKSEMIQEKKMDGLHLRLHQLRRIVCLPSTKDSGVCFGDTGGPLLCNGKVVGVAHALVDERSCDYFIPPEKPIQCTSEHVYRVYMYTCPYLDWINEYVPGVPSTPQSCSALINARLSIFMNSILFFYVFIS